ncbi:MAG TPA: thiolase family protein [Acidimicrobiia bacterium]|nr:thiolase family protein [Acidimicrobiia bacterium]
MAADNGANEIIERRACITGAGQSEIGRRLFRDPLDLTLDACLAAIDDAGLTVADIDGLSTYPGPMDVPPGFSGAGAYDVMDALRLSVGWYNSGLETSGQLGSVINACLAVASGLATHVVCFRSVWEGSAQGAKGRSAVMPGGGGDGGGGSGGGGGGGGGPVRIPRAGGFQQWTLPFSAPSAAIWIGMFAQRHFHQYGTTRDQLAQIALNARKNAALNPNAIYTDPMSMDDYFAARMISTPFCLFDCDVPCDGATAVVVSRRDAADGLRKTPIQVEAVGAAIRGRPSWDQFDDLSTMANRDAGAQLWTRTDLRPSDVQIAELYDGFSFLTMSWLEALGLCGVGESGPFVEGGARIARDGELPLNTHGGQLSGGRLHGYGFLHEACVQLWGEAGDRQVPSRPEVAIAAAGGGNTCGCLLLTHR